MGNTKNTIAAASLAVIALTLAGCAGKETKSAKKENEFEVATVRWADWGEAYHTGFPDEAAKSVGIEIKWKTILNSDWGDRRAVMLAGGDLPDAFVGSICFSESDIMGNAGTFIPLESYIDEHMPNLKKILGEDPNMRALATSSDGHIYGLPSKKPCRPVVANQLFINKTWLDNLGLKMPETYREFEDVLRAFKEKDANGNGNPNDEIPYGRGYADPVMFFTLPFGTNVGADGTYLMALKDGKPEWLPVSEGYKNGIRWMHECFEAGLIDAELFTQDESMRDAKLMGSTAVVGVAAGWTADATFGSKAGQYVPLPPLAGPDGKKYISSDPAHWNYSRYEFVVTSSCKNPGALLSWIDTFYTEDASIQNFYGSFGTGTRKNDDGTYSVLPPKDGQSADTYAWVNSLRDFGPKYVGDGFNARVSYEAENGDAAKLALDSSFSSYAREAYPNVSYTPEQINSLSLLYTDLGAFVSTNQAGWVTKGGIDGQWDAYVSTLKAMGLDTFLKIEEDAFATYEANSGKSGKKS